MSAPTRAQPSAAGVELEVHRLLDEFDTLTAAALDAAEGGDGDALSAALSARDGVIGVLGPLLSTLASGGATRAREAAALSDALARRIMAIVDQNSSLALRVVDKRDAIGAALRELEAEAAASAAYLRRGGLSPRLNVLR